MAIIIQKRNNLYANLRKYHIPRKLAYKITVFAYKR